MPKESTYHLMDGRQQCRFVCLYYLLTISLRSSARQELEMDNQQSYLIHSQLFYSIVVEKPRAFPWNKSKKIVLVSKILMTHLKKMLQLKSVDLWRTLIWGDTTSVSMISSVCLLCFIMLLIGDTVSISTISSVCLLRFLMLHVVTWGDSGVFRVLPLWFLL